MQTAKRLFNKEVMKMKKILSLVLVIILAFSALSLTGCGAINDSDVAILWRGEGEVKIPNSLINSMERAMYIESIAYTHYGANYSSDTQLQQAKDALNGGCSLLLVELVENVELFDDTLAEKIVDAAKAKGVPVIFFNCTVKESVINSYDKCVLVTSDIATIAEVQGTVIADYVLANFKNIDKNADGKISYAAYGSGLISSAAIAKANELLKTEEYVVKTANKEKINTSIVFYDAKNVLNTLAPIGAGAAQLGIMEKDEKAVEIILTEDDIVACDILKALQTKDYNTDKLTTHCIPIFTVGEDTDYKSLLLAGRPAIPADLVIKEGDSKKEIDRKNKEIKKIEELKSYYEANKFFVDLTAVNESDLGEMVYTTVNVIGAGRLAGTATEDIDSIATTAARIARNFIKGSDTFAGVDSEIVKGSTVGVPYKAYP